MSIILENAKAAVKEIEEKLNDPALHQSNEVMRDRYTKDLEIAKNKLAKLEKLEAEGLEKVAADMKTILSHTNAVANKYECRSVKFMFKVVEFLDNRISKSLAEKLRNYTINKIHAPVCAVVAGKKPELDPMPNYVNPTADGLAAARLKELSDLKKYRDLWVAYENSKPSSWERIKNKFKAFKNA